MTRVISRENDLFVVTDEATIAMGNMKDQIKYNADFQPVSRSISQMGQTITMTYTPGKIDVDMSGNKMSLDVKGALLNDGPGMDILVAGLPLKEGYTLVAEMPDITTMKTKQVQLSVTGSEVINGVNHLKVEIASTENTADKTTLWINPATGDASKMTQVIPAMGNAVITTTRK